MAAGITAAALMASPPHKAPARSQLDLASLSARPVTPDEVAGGWPPVWWVGCHGGAGTSTLARVSGLGIDAGTAWPTPAPGWPVAEVVLVCRASATGTWAATGALDQFRRRSAPVGVRVAGLVAVAGSPRRPPRMVDERLQLLGGWAPALWRVGWVEEYLAVEEPRDLGVPPDVAALRHAVCQALNIEVGAST